MTKYCPKLGLVTPNMSAMKLVCSHTTYSRPIHTRHIYLEHRIFTSHQRINTIVSDEGSMI